MWRHFAGRNFPLEGFCERLFPVEGFELGGTSPYSPVNVILLQRLFCLSKAEFFICRLNTIQL